MHSWSKLCVVVSIPLTFVQTVYNSSLVLVELINCSTVFSDIRQMHPTYAGELLVVSCKEGGKW